MLSCQDTEDTRYQPQQHTKHMLDGFKILSQANVEILKRCRISKRRQCFINQFLHRGELGGGGGATNKKKTKKIKKTKPLSDFCLYITYLDMGLLPLSSFAFLPSSTGLRLNRGVTSALPYPANVTAAVPFSSSISSISAS